MSLSRLPVRMSRASGVGRSRSLWLTTTNPDCISFAKIHKPDTLILSSPSDPSTPARVTCKVDSAASLKSLQAQIEGGKFEQGSTLVLDTTDWRIIPVENLVAASRAAHVTLLARTTSREDAEVLLGALEVGVDGLVLDTESPAVLSGVVQAMQGAGADSERLTLVQCEVTRVVPLPGLSDRVCVDTTNILTAQEGMLIGSFSRGMFLVKAEVDDAGYINARPFRVNAGAVHCYTAGPGGKTAYLSELKAGSSAQIISADGSVRSVSVGRAKIEKRPMVLIEARSSGVSSSSQPSSSDELHSVVLQNAETVKLFTTTEGKSVAVTDLKPGDKVLVYEQRGMGRHTGIAIEECIIEM